MNPFRIYLFLSFLFATCNVERQAETVFCALDRQARVIGIKDGDTIEVLWRNQSCVLRLAHVDCPERGQPFSKNAKQFTSDAVFNKTVRVECDGEKDRYGRYIAVVFTPEEKNLNRLLVENGYAWHFKKYSTDESYTVLENEARERQVGLWADVNAMPPWDWRNRKKKVQ